jgi:hypothetical protein
MLSKEATSTNFRVFGLTWSELKPTIYRTWGEHANVTPPGLQPTIYRTWGEHANHYITDALWLTWSVKKKKDMDENEHDRETIKF